MGKKEYLKTVRKKEAPKKTVRNSKKERPGVPAGECPKEITNDAGDKILVN